MKNLAIALLLLLSVVLKGSPSSAAELQCKMLPDLFKIFLRYHYFHDSLSPEIQSRTVEQFIKGVDPSKATLLESDVDQIRSDLRNVFKDIPAGRCAAIYKLNELLVKRSAENEKFAKEFLGDSYKFDENTELVLNPEKRSYFKTDAERQDFHRKSIHFQVSNYMLTDIKLPEAKEKVRHRYELLTKRMEERKAVDALNLFANAFASALDPHSTFLSKDNLEEFRIAMTLALEGIGVSLSTDAGYAVVEDVIPGGSADRLKILEPKDKIIAVAQSGQKAVSVIDMDLKDVVKMIRGKKGTKVTLTILRQKDKTERFDVTIVRDKINIKDQEAKLSWETRKAGNKKLKIGVIDLPSFYGEGSGGEKTSFRDVKRLVEKAVKEKADGLVLNLSRNGGGLLDDAVKMSGLFIRKGAVVATKSTDRKVDVLSDEDESVLYNGPLVVLTSRMSASASEILAGALKDYKRALVVGADHTFGKGTVQVFTPLPSDIGGMKVTTGMFFLPGGVSTQHAGVSGHIQIPSPLSSEELGERALDYSLPVQKIPPFLSSDVNSSDPNHAWVPLEPGLISQLADRSRQRVAKDRSFDDIRKEIEDLKRDRDLVRLADLRKKSIAEKGKEPPGAKKRTSAQKARDSDSPYLQEAVNIAADLAMPGYWTPARLGGSGTGERPGT